jgi:hypothetical protein
VAVQKAGAPSPYSPLEEGHLTTKPVRGPFQAGGHIGLIVVGSLVAGFVVALILVLGPFAGAQEHVILGTALLGFGFGWALLALLSILWTINHKGGHSC